MFTAHIRREGRLIAGNPAAFITPFVFYLIILVVFPIVVELSRDEIHRMVGALIWFAIALSFLSLMPRIFFDDIRQGVLDQIKVHQGDLKQYVMAKLIVMFIAVFGPVLLALPFVGMLYELAPWQLGNLFAAIVAGGIIMTSLGALLMALSVGLESEQALVAVLYLPLLVPVLILGALALDSLSGRLSIELLVAGAMAMMAFSVDLNDYILRVMLYE